MTKVLFNFSHPLSEKAKAQIREALGEEPKIVQVPVHLDLNESIAEQIHEILEPYRDLFKDKETSAVYIIPPGLSYAAIEVFYYFLNVFGFVNVVRLKPEGTPPTWVLAEISSYE